MPPILVPIHESAPQVGHCPSTPPSPIAPHLLIYDVHLTVSHRESKIFYSLAMRDTNAATIANTTAACRMPSCSILWIRWILRVGGGSAWGRSARKKKCMQTRIPSFFFFFLLLLLISRCIGNFCHRLKSFTKSIKLTKKIKCILQTVRVCGPVV